MTYPLVSVLINCHNGEKYLKEAIDSVYAQTYENWEIIFWDNASTDNTEEIAKSYNEKLKYFKTEEKTILGEARVQASKMANGKYVAFLDADDVWFEKKLELQISLFLEKRDDIGFVYGRSEVIYSNQFKNGFIINESSMLPEGDILSDLAKENFIVFSSAMVDRDKFFKCGGFPSHFLNSTDYWIFLHLAKVYSCRAVQEVCCKYRIHETNLSKTQRVISAKESINILNEMLPDDRILRALKSQYANLSVMYLKEFNFLMSIITVVKHKCFGHLFRRLIKKLIS